MSVGSLFDYVCYHRGVDYIIGIDEVGRGSLAGPVTVAAVAIPKGFRVRNIKLPLRDSKKLNSRQRKEWFEYFHDHSLIRYSLAYVYPRTIERINIREAANRAALRAFLRLEEVIKPARYSNILLDGGLFLGRYDLRYQKIAQSLQPFISLAKTITKGDEKIACIKVASILAKVSRDRAMRRLGRMYPRYGFEIHKGYGTRAHLKTLRSLGATPVHRLTFVNEYDRIHRA